MSIYLKTPFLILFTGFFFTNIQDWTLEKNKDKIQIYTRSLKGYDIKEYKAVMELKQNPEAVWDLLMDFNNYKNWIPNTTESKLLKKISDTEFYIYMVKDIPWPFDNRDIVFHLKFIKQSNGDFILKVTGKPDFIPQKEGFVRVPKHIGCWTITKKEKGMIQVQHQAIAKPGGSVPAWMANKGVVDIPFETFEKMKKELEK